MALIQPASEQEGHRSFTLQEFQTWAVVVTVAIVGVIFGLALIIAMFVGILPALVAFVAFNGIFFLNNFHYIDARQADKAIPMLFGKFVNKLIGPGWIFIPLKGLFFFDYQVVNGCEMDIDFDVQEIVPGDKSSIVISNEIYVTIDPDNPVKVIELGGLASVMKRLHEQVDQRERLWVCSPTEGPQNLDEARAMKDEALHAILQELLKDDVRRFDFGEFPREAILGFVKERKLTVSELDLKRRFDQKTSEEQDKLLAQGRELLAVLNGIHEGHLIFPLRNLGLVVHRFGVGNIQPTGETMESVNALNRAQFEAKVQVAKAEGFAKSARALKDGGAIGDPVEMALILEGKVSKEIKVNRFEVSDQILTVAQGLLGPLFKAGAERVAGSGKA